MGEIYISENLKPRAQDNLFDKIIILHSILFPIWSKSLNEPLVGTWL